MFLSFAVVFFVCDFGHRVSSAFEETNRSICKLNWYLLPIEKWKLLPIVIAGAHQPVSFTVFGSILCSREDFKMVRNLDFELIT